MIFEAHELIFVFEATKLSLPSSPCENPCLENCGWQGVRLLEFDPVSFELLDAHTYPALGYAGDPLADSANTWPFYSWRHTAQG